MGDFLMNSLFALSTGLIWFMIAYQFLLSIMGFFHYRASLSEKKKSESVSPEDMTGLPEVSVIIPAHNEEKVIEKTVRSVLTMSYPRDKLELIVVNDSSTDGTGHILERLKGEDDRVRIIHIAPPEGGKGKSRALNIALKEARSDIIAVYDADNRPEAHALLHLCRALVKRPELGGAIGMFRCENRGKNMLTRFINIEGIAFQWIVQAGRWKLLRIATLPGTNFVVRKELVLALGGWDEEALTEDSELSIRIFEKGKRIAFVPYSITWEQEPQTLPVWFKQRCRWVRGNNYVLGKFLKDFTRFTSKTLAVEILYTLSLYYIFLLSVLFSDIVFLLGITKLWTIGLIGPFSAVWGLGYLLFFLEIVLTLSYESEDSPRNAFLVVISYFTYCQAWLVVVIWAIAQELTKAKRQWVKTERV